MYSFQNVAEKKFVNNNGADSSIDHHPRPLSAAPLIVLAEQKADDIANILPVQCDTFASVVVCDI